jgi:hypothetical protein
MASQSSIKERPRELRRRLILPARLRAPNGWSDACILNVSSRGLQINSVQSAIQGATVEIWHREHVIVARVVWRKGNRAGLRAEQRVPVEELMTLGQAPSLQLTADQWPRAERRKRSRNQDENRMRARALEFAGMVIIAAWLAGGLLAMVGQAFARPMAVVEAVLGG